MAQCPRCGQSIEEDFGMITCPGCSTILFVDYEGNLQASGEQSSDQASEEPADFSVTPESEFSFAPAIEEPVYEEARFEAPEVVNEEPVEVESVDSGEAEPEQVLETPSFAPQTPAAALQEVVDFGNADLDEGHALTYEIVIESIDSKEVREQVFQILGDVRLGLNVRELQAKIKGGRLELGALNPVRASVVVSRLRELPVRLRWTQGVWKGE